MHCPSCGADRPKVLETRRAQKWARRVRRCRECGHCWNTIEVIETDVVRERLNHGQQLSLEGLTT